MATDAFQNLGSAFDAQQQQAGLAQLMSEEQFKQLQALNDPTQNLALAKQTADAKAGYPTIETSVNAFGPADGILKGINQGMANRQKINAYNQQVKAYQDIQNAYLQNQAKQRELVMGQIQAQNQQNAAAQQYLQGTNPGAAALYPYLDPAGRQSLLNSIGTKEVGLQYKPMEGTAEGQAQVNKGQAINTAVSNLGPVEVGGVPIPGKVDAAHNIQGFAPTTTVDVNKGILANRGQLLQNQSEANKLTVQPQQLQQDLEKGSLDNQVKRVEAQFAEQSKILQIKRDQLANAKGTVEYKKAMDEYSRFQKGEALFKALQDSGTLATNDPQKQAEIQAQLGMFGVKYDPPNSKYTTIKHKDGSVYQLDSNNNMVRAIIDKNGKPSFGAWQALEQ